MEAKKMFIGLAVVIALLITIGSALAVSPELEISDIKVGKTGGSLVSYANSATTSAFYPGEEITVKVKLKNNENFTLEDLQINLNAHADLTDFPTTEVLPEPAESFHLLAGQEKEVTYTYKIPSNLNTWGESNYIVQFGAEGEDEAQNWYGFSREFFLKVKQNQNNVFVDGTPTYDNDLTCQDKEQSTVEYKVKLVNNGLEEMTEVKVELSSPTVSLGVAPIVATVETESNNPGAKYVTFQVDPKLFTGQHQVTVKVYRLAQYPTKLYDTETVTVTGQSCTAAITSFSPAGTSLASKEDAAPQQFSVTVSNPGNAALTYKWFVGTDNQNDNDNSFTFDPAGVGDYVVKVTVTGTNINLNKEWAVKVSDRPVDASQFPGTSTTNLAAVQNPADVTSFTLDNGFGKIAFTQNVDLSEILYLAEVVSISDSKVTVKSNLAPELNKPATITIKKSFDDPVIQKLDQSTNTFVDCSTCSLVSKSNGLVVFTVPGFSTYQVVEDNAGFLSVSKVEINGKTTGDLTLSEVNDVEVEIKNSYTEDMEESKVEVTLRLLDEEGDEVYEKTEELAEELKEGKEEILTFKIDLSNEDLNDDTYTLEIEVEGEATDDSKHTDTHSQSVEVDRSDSDIAITKAELSNNNLVCSSRTSLRVTVKNNGEDDYQDLMLRVRNNALNLDLSKSNIDVEDYTSDDDEYQATFEVDVADAAAGTYALDLELRDEDDDVLDSEQVELILKACGSPASASGNEYYADAALTAELQKKLAERELADQTTVKATFRESDQYTLLLGVLVVMMGLAAVLALVVMLAKKR